MKIIKKILADIIFIIHHIVVFIILFGWLFPSLEFVYINLLLLTLFSWWGLRDCILTQLEYKPREGTYQNIEKYDMDFLDFYIAKVFGARAPSKKVIEPLVWLFLISSIIIYFLTH